MSRAQTLGLSWRLPDDLTDQALLAMMQPPKSVPEATAFTEPDFAQVHQELKRKGMTLQLLWEEYAQAHPHHYSYSRFTVHYRA